MTTFYADLTINGTPVFLLSSARDFQEATALLDAWSAGVRTASPRADIQIVRMSTRKPKGTYHPLLTWSGV
jgi:hypothetical protein